MITRCIQAGLITLALATVCPCAEPTPAPAFATAEHRLAVMDRQMDEMTALVKGIAGNKVYVSRMAGGSFDERLRRAVKQASHGGRAVVIGPHDQPGKFIGPLTIPQHVPVEFQGGSFGFHEATHRLNIQGPIVASGGPIFVMPLPKNKAALRLVLYDSQWVDEEKCNRYLPTVPAMWFDDGGRDDIGERINKAIRCSGHDAVVTVGPWRGDWKDGTKNMLRSTIDMHLKRWYHHQTLRGQNHIGSTLVISADRPIVGLNCGGSKECRIENIRITEQRPPEGKARQSACIAVGGVDMQVNGCWFGNAKYGIVCNTGIGQSFSDIIIEHCDVGAVVSGDFNDDTIGGLLRGRMVMHPLFDNVELHRCKTVGLNVGRSVTGARFHRLTIKGSPVNVQVTGRTIGDISCEFDGCIMTGALCKISKAKVRWRGGFVYGADSPAFEVADGSTLHIANTTHGSEPLWSKDATSTVVESGSMEMHR